MHAITSLHLHKMIHNITYNVCIIIHVLAVISCSEYIYTYINRFIEKNIVHVNRSVYNTHEADSTLYRSRPQET